MMHTPAGGRLCVQEAEPMAQRLPRMSTQLREISLEYSYSELSKATRNWHSSKKVGSGSYGSVYRGELEDGSEVAIKAINLGALGAAGQGPEMAGFDEEVQMLSKFRHPNLVTLLGWGKQDLYRYLVYELLAGGDAFQRLQRSKQPGGAHPFHWYERVSVCQDASTGLSHMHNSKPKAFHRDIKSANILLDRHGTAKMADFGLSCTSGRSGALHVTVKTISGTPGYACPIYSRTGRVTEGSEVYSFGMVMLELLTGLAPAAADPSRPGGIVYHVADAVVPGQPGALERCLRSLDASAGWPLQLASELGAFALRCVNANDEQQRPRFVEIVRTLRGMAERYPRPSPGCPGPGLQAVVAAQAPAAQAAPAALAAQPQPAAVSGARAVTVRAAAAEAPASPAPPAPAQQAEAPHQHYPAAAALPATREAPVRSATSTQTLFWLEFVRAVGLETAEALPPERRRLPLFAPAGTGASAGGAVGATAPVGRQHQPEVFEAWLPDESLRGCISRTAFEVSWGARGDGARLIARGANPLSVDGRVVARDTCAPLRPSSEIGFTYSSSGEINTFLLLRFVPATTFGGVERLLAADAAAIARTAGNGGAVAAAAAAAPVGSPEQPSTKAPVLRVQSSSTELTARGSPGRKSTEGGGRAGLHSWSLVCVHAEGLSAVALAALPAQVQQFDVLDGTILIGRQHQPEAFEALLVGAPTRLSFISRTHVQLEAHGRARLVVTNMSTNPLYVDSELLTRGEARALVPGQVLGFARLEAGAHVHFLRLQLREEAPGSSGLAAAAVPPPAEAPARGAASVAEPRLRGSAAAELDFLPPRRVAASPAGSEREAAAQAVRPAAWEPSEQQPSAAAATPPPAVRASPAGPMQQPPLPQATSPAGSESLSPERRPLGVRGSSPLRLQAWDPQQATPPPRSAGASPPPPEPALDGAVASSPVRGRPAEQAAQRSPAQGTLGSDAVAGSLPEVTPEQPGVAPAEARGGGEPLLVLELRGEGVLAVLPEQRRIGPVALGQRALLVGRRHQPELHRRAVARECLQFLSRDHFRLSAEGGELRLLALTSNPIWRDRDGAKPVELARGDVISVAPGDRILLGTGGDASLAEDARRSLCWHLLRASDVGSAEAASAAPERTPARAPGAHGASPEGSPGSSPRTAPARPGGFGTPPSPGGRGPRVSDAVPRPRGGGSGSRSAGQLLPPAAEALGAEAGKRGLLPRFGGGASGALRAPLTPELAQQGGRALGVPGCHELQLRRPAQDEDAPLVGPRADPRGRG